MLQIDQGSLLKLKFVVVGVWNTFFGLILFLILLKIFSQSNYFILLVVSFLVSTTQSHSMQRRFVWKSDANYPRELLKFFVGTSGTFVINLVTLPFFVEVLNFPIYLSQILLVLLLTILGYSFQKYLVFPSQLN